MKYISFILLLIGGVLSFNSYAADPESSRLQKHIFNDADYVCIAKPIVSGYYGPFVHSGSDFYINLGGCIYKATGIFVDIPGFVYLNADWKPVVALPVDKVMPEAHINLDIPDDKPASNESNSPSIDSSSDNQADNSSTGGSSNGFPDGGSSGSSTPQPSEPEKPYPADAGVSQLLDLYNSCHSQAYDLFFNAPDNVFNSVAQKCNAILERLSSVLIPDEIGSFSDDGQSFLIKNSSNSVLLCHKTTDMERQQMIA
ncbi:hypothetical protein ACE60T_005916, partial [Salmonella enterica]